MTLKKAKESTKIWEHKMSFPGFKPIIFVEYDGMEFKTRFESVDSAKKAFKNTHSIEEFENILLEYAYSAN